MMHAEAKVAYVLGGSSVDICGKPFAKFVNTCANIGKSGLKKIYKLLIIIGAVLYLNIRF